MTESIVEFTNDPTMVRLSETSYKIKVFKSDGTPQSLDGIDLMLIAKAKLTDADDAIIFTLTLGDGLEIDTAETGGHGLIITIGSLDTESLSETKDSSIYCELIQNSPRKTLGKRFPLPVLASVKRGV